MSGTSTMEPTTATGTGGDGGELRCPKCTHTSDEEGFEGAAHRGPLRRLLGLGPSKPECRVLMIDTSGWPLLSCGCKHPVHAPRS